MTKWLILILFFFSITSTSAQDTAQVEPPKIITKLKIGESLKLDTAGLKFIAVKEDNRCPSDVNCFWEGQVTILVGISKDSEQLEEKEFTLKGKGANLNTKKEILTTEDKNIFMYKVSPYPHSSSGISEDNYVLELIVK